MDASTVNNRINKPAETPEQLLDVFKAAALSVTKLYRTSAAAEARARTDGYQDCLDDLLVLLEREGASLGGEIALSKLRRWIADRRDGRDQALQTSESDEDDVEKTENVTPPPGEARDVTPSQVSLPPRSELTSNPQPRPVAVPTQDNFTFQSNHPYPNIATLDLSDNRTHETNHHPPRTARRFGNNAARGRGSGPLGRGAGTKRRSDFDDFFGNYFNGKDNSGPGGKRSRHN